MQLSQALRLSHKNIVAAVGAGGKTTILGRLAQEIAAQGACVVSTTTTHVWEPSGTVVVAPHRDQIIAELAEHIRPGQIVTVARGRSYAVDDESGRTRAKLAGVSAGVPALLAAVPGVDYVLVEADGARGRALKAPAAHEPVIPESVSGVLAVAGIEALGQPLDEEVAHRPERISALLGLHSGATLSSRHIAALLAHEQGGRKGVPPAARFIPFINKVENEESLRGARSVAVLLRGKPGVDSILIGSALSANPVLEIW